MTRQIVLDTETTGLSPRDGHRIVEIGAIELFNHVPTNRSFHVYLNPERDMPKDAEAIHGLSSGFLRGKPLFRDVVADFLAFLQDSALIIHNASFDLAFLNHELEKVGKEALETARVTDTLLLARQKHPMAPNSLDALCKRYGIDLSRRTRHGALLDSELLAEVYLELIGGRQTVLSLAQQEERGALALPSPWVAPSVQKLRPRPLPSRLTDEEVAAHGQMVAGLGWGSRWPKE
jgi:DNA polymerase III subunit epsilon